MSVLMIAFAAGIVLLSVYAARNDERYLVEFVARVIQGNDANKPLDTPAETIPAEGAVAEFLRSSQAINKAKI